MDTKEKSSAEKSYKTSIVKYKHDFCPDKKYFKIHGFPKTK